MTFAVTERGTREKVKRASKTEKQIAAIRQGDIAREQRTVKRRGCTEERPYKALPAALEQTPKPKPLRKDADALDLEVHALEIENRRRVECGLPTLSYGQARLKGVFSKPKEKR